MYRKINKVVGMQNLARAVAHALSEVGFNVTNVDGLLNAAVTPDAKRIVLAATNTVDPKASNEPWSIVIEGHDLDRWLSVNVVPTVQVSDSGVVSKSSETTESGRLSVDCKIDRYFVDFKRWGISDGATYDALPFSIYVCTTDHGVAVHISIDSLDRTGKAFSWFCIQRPVQPSNLEVPVGPAPLFAVFRSEGGGDPDVYDPNEVIRITVRERDIHAAAAPVTACGFAPDVTPIINAMQQVAVTYDNNAIISFPQSINTHRHVYALTLDMLGYTSADICSSASEVPIVFAGNPERTYTAMNANGANNRGLRVLFPQ